MKYVLKKSGLKFDKFQDVLDIANSTMGETTVYVVSGEYRIKDGEVKLVSGEEYVAV